MSVLIRGRLAGTAVTLVHGPSGAEISTVPPVDNGGDGSRFSPTDLCAASLGACASTVLGLYAIRNGIDVEGVEFTVEKEMSGAPRRIGRLTLTMRIRTDCSERDFERLVGAARACPVRLTLGEGIEIVESYERARAGVPA